MMKEVLFKGIRTVSANAAFAFGDDDDALESFVREVVKPAVKEDIGYDLVDMRDVSKAGIIDNIMRVRIRDAKFVITDLTHGNNGAYWEAGLKIYPRWS